jgi:hypothetical protein
MIVLLEKDGIKKSKFKVMFYKIESYELGMKDLKQIITIFLVIG